MNPDIKILVVDLFCGAGGVTTGFEKTPGCKVIVCINHDAVAIESHKANHPNAIHFIEDIRQVNMAKLCKIVNTERIKYPNAKLLVHASLECTNFSKAKGGKARDADSRSLADDMPRYAWALNPDFFTIENVTEFMSWGPLDENGKPISKQAGCDYVRWVNEMKAIGEGYNYDWKHLVAADYGAYTIRKRFFAVFAKKYLPIMWPEPTHTKNPEKVPKLQLQKWKPVRDVLDLADRGNSIFERVKSEKTYERIYAGLVKFVPKNEAEFIAKHYSGRPEGKVKSLNEPAGAITTIDHHSIVSTHLLKYNSINGKTGKYCPPSIDEPSPTVAAQNRLALVTPNFLIQYNGKPKDSVNSVNNPVGTLCTKDRFATVQPQFVLRDFTTGFLNDINEPSGALLTVPKINLVSVETCYLLNPQWGTTQNRGIDEPCFTLIARMDKAPPYLVQVESGEVYIQVYETDSPMVRKIKQFMAEHGIYDIKMRMLKVEELLAIQGFPKNYKLCGNQTNQKKFVGNSVETTVMHKWASALVESVKQLKVA